MTAVANPPSLPPNLSRPGWGINGNAMNSDESRGMFAPRKNIQRTNSSSSIASNNSASSGSTLVSSNGSINGAPVSAAGDLSGWPRKRPPPKGQWVNGKPDAQAPQGDFSRLPNPRPQLANALNGTQPLHQAGNPFPTQGQISTQTGIARPMGSLEPGPPGQPVLYLLSLNGTFERKTISVPFQPDALKIGRQTNAKTVPTPTNGYFDSKVLSRQHAEIWADRAGKIWIRDVKSSNGTFVNGARLSQENRESEPHELQTSDHLELGIDIVREDQKSVEHHKVAAKVEHAGILTPSSNLLDMSFGDLDPTNGSLMMPPGSIRGRIPHALNGNPRIMQAANVNGQAGMGLQRGFAMTTGPSTEAIVKKLHLEMRNARLQAQNLARTQQFISTLLSKDDIKNEQKPEVPDPPKGSHLVNGNALSFRSDPKNRFSDPPAPPPQQPLPEKPDVSRSSDMPSLKRGITERPKSIPPPGAANTSPVRQDNFSQILQLTEALNTAKREIDTQHAKMRDLEEMLLKERQARESAEEVARKLEDAAALLQMNGGTLGPSSEAIVDALIPNVKGLQITEPGISRAVPDIQPDAEAATKATQQQIEAVETSAAQQQAQIEMMVTEIKTLKMHLDQWQQRAEKAEKERDSDRETLAEMVRKIQQRDEADAARQEAERARSLSRGRRKAAAAAAAIVEKQAGASVDGTTDAARARDSPDELSDDLPPTLSRSNTITPSQGGLTKASRDPLHVQGIPYASMFGVVLLGMGLMAYLNGWQPEPPRASR